MTKGYLHPGQVFVDEAASSATIADVDWLHNDLLVLTVTIHWTEPPTDQTCRHIVALGAPRRVKS